MLGKMVPPPFNEGISIGLLVRALEGWDLGIRFSKTDQKNKEFMFDLDVGI